MLLTESSQRLPELVLINEAWIVSVVGPEDVLPVGDVLPYAGKFVEVHPTFIFPVEHGWKKKRGRRWTLARWGKESRKSCQRPEECPLWVSQQRKKTAWSSPSILHSSPPCTSIQLPPNKRSVITGYASCWGNIKQWVYRLWYSGKGRRWNYGDLLCKLHSNNKKEQSTQDLGGLGGYF